jgi:hypothetical protein
MTTMGSAPRVAGLLETRPREPDDRDPGHSIGPAGLEPGRHAQRSLFPLPAPVMVAADVDERDIERVGEERQPLRLEIATAEDAVQRAERLAVRGILKGRLLAVGGGEEPNRPPVAAGEGP